MQRQEIAEDDDLASERRAADGAGEDVARRIGAGGAGGGS